MSTKLGFASYWKFRLYWIRLYQNFHSIVSNPFSAGTGIFLRRVCLFCESEQFVRFTFSLFARTNISSDCMHVHTHSADDAAANMLSFLLQFGWSSACQLSDGSVLIAFQLSYHVYEFARAGPLGRYQFGTQHALPTKIKFIATGVYGGRQLVAVTHAGTKIIKILQQCGEGLFFF